MRTFLLRFRWFIAVCIAVWLLTTIPLTRGVVTQALSPLAWVSRRGVESTLSAGRIIREIPRLAQENAQLQAQLNEKESQLVRLTELEHENTILRNELNLVTPNQAASLIAAQVVARSASVTQQTLTINKGADDGLTKGMPIVSQGYIIGTVQDTLPHVSHVRLITSSESLLPVLLQNSRAIGLLRGGPEGLVLDEIPRDISIQPDESVITSDIGNVMKSGLPIGKVQTIISSSSDVFQSARVVSPINFSRLEIVFGVK